MSNSIHTGLNPANPVGPTKSSVSRQETEQPATHAAAADSRKDEVKVTQQATRLQELEGNLKSDSAVNEALIAEVKAAIADGSLDMDMQETAQKLVEMESNRKPAASSES